MKYTHPEVIDIIKSITDQNPSIITIHYFWSHVPMWSGSIETEN